MEKREAASFHAQPPRREQEAPLWSIPEANFVWT
jgi:hypothetical protein